jgi:5-methylthioadenosine/S-adenosylhomocysteine deaminase
VLPLRNWLLKAAHSSVASCPVSNSKMACGIAPLQAMIDAGVNVGIGTDGSCSNNSLDMCVNFVGVLVDLAAI